MIMKSLSVISNSDTEEILNIIEQFQSTWSKKDISGMMSLFTEDAEFTDIIGQIARGKDMVKLMHEQVFQHVMKGAVLNIYSVYMREVGNDLILVTGKWNTEKHEDFEGKEMPLREGVIQFMCKKQGSEWKISLVYNTDMSKMYTREINTDFRFFE